MNDKITLQTRREFLRASLLGGALTWTVPGRFGEWRYRFQRGFSLRLCRGVGTMAQDQERPHPRPPIRAAPVGLNQFSNNLQGFAV
jgi:hypothetical protein